GASVTLGVWSTLAADRRLAALDRDPAWGQSPDSRLHDVFPAQCGAVTPHDADTEQRTGACRPRFHGSEGLRGGGEWQREKHGVRGRCTWRKLHLAVDPHSSEILASELTSNAVGDPSM